MKVLVVDDSMAARQIIKGALEVLGYDSIEAANGKEGFEVLEANEGAVDLILLDWNMPVMDGVTMLKKVKTDKRFSAIPVTMVTTEIERHRVVEAVTNGAKNYVMKPFTQEELIGKILDCLGLGI